MRLDVFRDDKKGIKGQFNRWNRINVTLKKWLIYPSLYVVDKFLGRFIIKDINDIEPAWHNNNARIFYYTFEKSLKEAYEQVLDANFDQENIKGRSYRYRLLFMKIFLTFVLEDMFNKELLNIWTRNYMLEQRKTYKGENPLIYPIFPTENKHTRLSPEDSYNYYIKNSNEIPTWYNEKEVTFTQR